MFNSNQASIPSFLGALLIAASLLVAGCTNTTELTPTKSTASENGAKKKRMASQFNDMPIPEGANMNVEKTVVVGSEIWFGQLSLDTNHSANSMFDFYERELDSYGWRKLTSVRASTSILSYERQARMLTIAIQPGRILGSTITITVSPKEKSAAPSQAPSPALAPAPAPIPRTR